MPVKKLGTPIKIIDGVKQPEAVAINQRREVVVTEGVEDCVSVFSSSGEKLRLFGTHGSNQGQFMHPCGMAIEYSCGR